MSHSTGRSPRYEPQPPNVIPNTNNEASGTGSKSTPISPLSSLIGPSNMILVWTVLAIVVFVLFVVFYISFNPLPSTLSATSTVPTSDVGKILNDPHNTPPVG